MIAQPGLFCFSKCAEKAVFRQKKHLKKTNNCFLMPAFFVSRAAAFWQKKRLSAYPQREPGCGHAPKLLQFFFQRKEPGRCQTNPGSFFHKMITDLRLCYSCSRFSARMIISSLNLVFMSGDKSDSSHMLIHRCVLPSIARIIASAAC